MLAGFLHLASARQDKMQIAARKEDHAPSPTSRSRRRTDPCRCCGRSARSAARWRRQIAARLLQNNWGGKGILIGGVPGVPPAEVVVLGAGVVGTYATQTFLGMGAHVTVIDHSLAALQRLWDRFPNCITLLSTKRNIERSVAYADVVVGAVLDSGRAGADPRDPGDGPEPCGRARSSWT